MVTLREKNFYFQKQIDRIFVTFLKKNYLCNTKKKHDHLVESKAKHLQSICRLGK